MGYERKGFPVVSRKALSGTAFVKLSGSIKKKKILDKYPTGVYSKDASRDTLMGYIKIAFAYLIGKCRK